MSFVHRTVADRTAATYPPATSTTQRIAVDAHQRELQQRDSKIEELNMKIFTLTKHVSDLTKIAVAAKEATEHNGNSSSSSSDDNSGSGSSSGDDSSNSSSSGSDDDSSAGEGSPKTNRDKTKAKAKAVARQQRKSSGQKATPAAGNRKTEEMLTAKVQQLEQTLEKQRLAEKARAGEMQAIMEAHTAQVRAKDTIIEEKETFIQQLQGQGTEAKELQAIMEAQLEAQVTEGKELQAIMEAHTAQIQAKDATIEEKNNLIQQLETQFVQLETQLEGGGEPNSDAQAKIQQLERELKQGLDDIQQYSSAYKALQDEYQVQMEQLQVKEAEASQLEAEVSQLEDYKSRQMRNSSDLQLKLENAQRDLKEERAAKIVLERELRAHVDTVQQDVGTNKDLLTERDKTIAEREETIADLQAELKRWLEDAIEKENSIKELQREVNDQKGKIESQSEKIAKLSDADALRQKNGELGETIRALNMKVVSLKDAISQKQVENEQLGNALSAESSQLSKLQQQLAKVDPIFLEGASKVIKGLKSKLQEAEVKNTATELERQQVVEELTKLKSAVGDKDQIIAELTSSIRQLSARIEENDAAAAKAVVAATAIVENEGSFYREKAQRDDRGIGHLAAEILGSELAETKKKLAGAEMALCRLRDPDRNAGEGLIVAATSAPHGSSDVMLTPQQSRSTIAERIARNVQESPERWIAMHKVLKERDMRIVDLESTINVLQANLRLRVLPSSTSSEKSSSAPTEEMKMKASHDAGRQHRDIDSLHSDLSVLTAQFVEFKKGARLRIARLQVENEALQRKKSAEETKMHDAAVITVRERKTVERVAELERVVESQRKAMDSLRANKDTLSELNAMQDARIVGMASQMDKHVGTIKSMRKSLVQKIHQLEKENLRLHETIQRMSMTAATTMPMYGASGYHNGGPQVAPRLSSSQQFLRVGMSDRFAR